MDYQKAICDIAKLAGWRLHAELPGQTASGRYLTRVQGHVGFPDLVLVHPGRQLIAFVELKRKPNKASDDQLAWLAAIQAASPSVVAALVFVPEGLPRLTAFLTDPSVTTL